MTQEERQQVIQSNRSHAKWTLDEDECLFRHVKAHPTNLTACFFAVSEKLTSDYMQTGKGGPRTPAAVSAHWYTRVSKDPKYMAFFTASSRHVAKNRKNGEGEPITTSIWQRFLRILRSL